ncbi:hypothetical protein [Nocardioides sp.]|uniref:hypothetical protein n=1 Tax=Nocardioides sp. TaxID=35761 RepID=UPI002B70082E|nr:hypothetical protein [Nocardioides sp.]HXH80316.1 hypothetical protein [Nocardioides sp.]
MEERHADLVLYVSNQSFDDEEVHLTVAVDGRAVVDGNFHVEDQHNWVKFPLEMSSGAHKVTAEVDTGAALSETFRALATRHASRSSTTGQRTINDPREFSWSSQREP